MTPTMCPPHIYKVTGLSGRSPGLQPAYADISPSHLATVASETS